MSHLHIPDGVLPLWLWIGGFCVFVIILALALWRLKGGDAMKKLPFLGAVAALMVIGMSFPVVPPMYHLNLSVLAGIILGPVFGVLAVFLSNLILALFAHGGITVIGLNSLILVFEVAGGWFLFNYIFGFLGEAVFWRGFSATLLTLAVSTFLAIGIVTLGGADWARFAEVSLALGSLGWLLEGLITGFIVSYLKKTKFGIIDRS